MATDGTLIGISGSRTGFIEKTSRNPDGNPEIVTGIPKTGRQDQQPFAFGFGLGAFGQISPYNPCGFPGYGAMYLGTFETYRFMRRHPILAHVRAQIRQAIIANAAKASLMMKDDTNVGMKALLSDMFNPEQNVKDIEAATLGMDFGFAAFEQVWETRQGRKWMKSRSLAPDGLTMLCDDKGLWAGIKFGNGEDDWLNRRECWFYGNDMEFDEFYGQARFENVRETAWKGWLDDVTKLALLGMKAAGKLVVVTTPAGDFTDENGVSHSWEENAMRAGMQATDPRSNGWIWLPSLAVPENLTKENIDLSKISFVGLEVKDLGDQGPAITATLAKVIHWEALLSAGYLRSPRTNQESKNGSRADAEVHTDADATDLEYLQDRMFAARNKAVADVLELNFGPNARDQAWFKPAPIRDQERAIFRVLVDGVMKNPQTSTQFLSRVSWKPVAEKLAIPILDPEDEFIIDPVDDNSTNDPNANQDQAPDPENDPTDPTDPEDKKE